MRSHSAVSDGRIVVPALVFVGTTIYLANAFYVAPVFENGEPSASFFPVVLSVVMYAALIPVILRAAREVRQAPADRSSLADPLKVVLLTAAYIALFKPLGYFVSTTLYVYGLFFVFRYGDPRKAADQARRVIGAILIAVAFFLFFGVAFHIRLPKLAGII